MHRELDIGIGRRIGGAVLEIELLGLAALRRGKGRADADACLAIAEADAGPGGAPGMRHHAQIGDAASAP